MAEYVLSVLAGVAARALYDVVRWAVAPVRARKNPPADDR